ncbi:MAG: histone deacetylase family protein [Thermoplasmatota archaeon]
MRRWARYDDTDAAPCTTLVDGSMILIRNANHAAHANPAHHPEKVERIEWALEALAAFEKGHPISLEEIESQPASVETMGAVHDPALIERLLSLDAKRGGAIDDETVMAAGSWGAIRHAAGAAIEAARRAAAGTRTFALVRPPGHHATRTHSQGFCFVNNVAIAAEQMLRTGRARRIAIVDHDVHHGNGTQDIFYDRPDVLYVSSHNFPWYPMTGRSEEVGAGPGEGYTVNMPLPPGVGEAAWKEAHQKVAFPILRAFEPDLVIVSAGFDSDWRDPLGAMKLGPQSFDWLYRELLAIQPRLAAVLEGGYDPRGLAEGFVAAVAAMAGVEPGAFGAPPIGIEADAAIADSARALAPFWRL